MKQFLAKSNGETIVEHTNNLLENFEKLQELYPTININWRLLAFACLFHDFGKMNKKFQEKVGQGASVIKGEIPHGLLSVAFLTEEILENYFSFEEITALAYAIANHHERDYSKLSCEEYLEEIEQLESAVQGFPYQDLKRQDNFFLLEELELESKVPEELSSEYYEFATYLYPLSDKEAYDIYIMLKGLLNRIDHAASAYIPVEYPNYFLKEAMSNLGYIWNPLQQYMLEHQEENVVVIAQTGMGKTEAGLLWLGNDKGFFTLPLRTAINAIYDRIQKDIIKERPEEKIGLLHSETFSQYLEKYSEKDSDVITEYETSTTQWALPLTICTLDQVFDFVYLYGGYEAKLSTLSYSKVIIDEIQMYSADLLAYLIKGLEYITKAGGKFAILTATLPPFILELLKERGIDFTQPEQPFIDEKLPLRHSLKMIHEEITVKSILNYYQEKKVLVICNTVRKAKEICEQLQKELGENEVQLFHSQFIKKDRGKKEQQIFDFGQAACKKTGVWVTTQVVEASLDIDFDILFTELTDLNGLFQRMGRCYRKRSWREAVGTNVFVFDGGEKRCSGVGYVVDKDLYRLSKKELKTITGPLNEQQKMDLIQKTYTTEKVNATDYYKLVKNNINYLELIIPGEKPKKDVKKIFRNINNITVLPLPVYKKYRVEIEMLLSTLKKKNEENADEKQRKELKFEKREARTNLNQFLLDLPAYAADYDQIVDYLELNKYEKIPIFDCEYTKETGVTLKKKEKEDCFF